jgi:hypothetical protein
MPPIWVVLGALMTCSCVMMRHAMALPLPPYITVLTNQSQVTPPTRSALQSGCMVGFDDTTVAFPLESKHVLIVATPGSDAFSVTTAYQYYSARGADITLYCGDPSAATTNAPIPLLDTYTPKYTVDRSACWNGTKILDASIYDAVVVPLGFAAVLSLRSTDDVFQLFLSSFSLAAAQNGRQRVLVVFDEAAEILVEPRLFSAAPFGSEFPSTTPTIPLAIASINASQRIAVRGNISQAVIALLPTANVSSQGLVVAVTSNATTGGVIPLLVEVSRAVFGYNGDLWDVGQQSVDCSDTSRTTPFVYPTVIFQRVDADAALATTWASYVNRNLVGSEDAASLNTSSAFVDLSAACLNAQGVNTCSGKKYGVVIAHGTHDLQLLGLLRGFAAIGAQPELYCPDRDERGGTVYAMPMPPLFPSLAVTCTHYYNESYIVFDDSIIVVGGAIATHRRLRLDKPLLQALDQAPSFALYGTALILLQTIHQVSVSGQTVIEIPVVPRCPFTNVDLLASGFAVSNHTPFAETDNATGVLQYRDHVTKQRQRELGGYEYVNTTFISFPLFVQQVLGAQAWNQQQGSVIDKIVGALFISAAVLTVVGVLGFKIVQRRLKKSRGNQYVAVRRDDDETSLY